MMASLTHLVESSILTDETVRLARHLAYLYGEDDETVVVATACVLTVLSAGSICFDLERASELQPDSTVVDGATPADSSGSAPSAGADGPRIEETVASKAPEHDTESTAQETDSPSRPIANDESAIQWPDALTWATVLAASPMVSTDPTRRDRPLLLDNHLLYLTRYWVEQEQIATWLTDHVSRHLPTAASDGILSILFADSRPDQRQAAHLALTSMVCVVAGGPGTGKTTVVARLLAALGHQQTRPLRVVLCAPTGRAATHLGHSVERNLAPWQARADTRFEQRCEVGTIHRLLGLTSWSRPRHDRTNPLAADVVVVDEASMLSAHLMACLLDAIGPMTRLVLVGDPDQLASVEAGAVLADIVAAAPTVPVARLSHTYRFSGAIADLAEAIRVGDSIGALAILGAKPPDIEWIQADLADPALSPDTLGTLRQAVTTQSRGLIESARAGDVRGALLALESHRLLAPHRLGPTGVSRWTQIVRGWTARLVGMEVDQRRWYAGLPVLITRNDDVQQVYNGDSGVIIDQHGALRLALSGDDQRLIVPDMIDSWEPLLASTIHKAQGSQFEAVTLLLPPTGTALLTRELFYTAVTRAKSTLRIVGTATEVEHAIQSRALRASGLTSRLGGDAELRGGA